MRLKKLMMLFTAFALSTSLVASGWAKPNKGNNNDRKNNHGKTVSRVARDKDGNSRRNHGQKVSRVASSKSKRNTKTRHGTRRYRTVRRYNTRTRRYESFRRWSTYDSKRGIWRRD